jgi:YHS domain-containing protein
MYLLVLTAFLMFMSAGAPGGFQDGQAGMSGMQEAEDALDGLDPVLLVAGREVPGKPAISVNRGGFVYLFSTPETKATFEGDPTRYEIQLGGMCARMGKTAGGNPSDFLVHNGRIYVFGSDDCHKKFQADPAKYLPTPAPPLPFSAAAAAQGQELLERAVVAIGGAARIDALTAYSESMSQVQARPQGEVTVATKTIWSFPDRVRQERTMMLQGKAMTSATVLSPQGMWFVSGQGQVYPIRAAGRSSMEQEFGRNPIALLHARHSRGFTPVSLGKGTIDGIAVDNLRIVNGPIDVTLALEASGRIHSATYRDRNADGEFGTFVITYSDFKSVENLQLPHATAATFNGQPYAAHTAKLDTIAINEPVASTLFAPADKSR